jgi:hypothetical protein
MVLKANRSLASKGRSYNAPIVYSEHLTGDGQETCRQAGLGGHCLQKCSSALPIRPERGVAENQNRSDRQTPRHWIREGSERRCCPLPR